MRTYKIYLIRHGLTKGNLEGRYTGGDTDLDLCEEGVRELLALKNAYEYPNVGRVYASPMKRCLETARLLYPEIAPVAVEGLWEYRFGPLEGRTPQELAGEEDYRKWIEGVSPMKGAEDMEAFKSRVLEGFDAIIRDMMAKRISDAAVVTHGGVIMAFLARSGLPKRPLLEWKTDSGKGYTLLVNASLWAKDKLAEVFTPIPYGTDTDKVMLDYQKELPYEYGREDG